MTEESVVHWQHGGPRFLSLLPDLG